VNADNQRSNSVQAVVAVVVAVIAAIGAIVAAIITFEGFDRWRRQHQFRPRHRADHIVILASTADIAG
jgi:uncharacterized protein involved in response to NO